MNQRTKGLIPGESPMPACEDWVSVWAVEPLQGSEQGPPAVGGGCFGNGGGWEARYLDSPGGSRRGLSLRGTVTLRTDSLWWGGRGRGGGALDRGPGSGEGFGQGAWKTPPPPAPAPPPPAPRWGGVQHVEGIWKRSQTRNGKLEVIHV